METIDSKMKLNDLCLIKLKESKKTPIVGYITNVSEDSIIVDLIHAFFNRNCVGYKYVKKDAIEHIIIEKDKNLDVLWELQTDIIKKENRC